MRGIVDAGYFEYNANFMLTSLENAQDLYDLGDAVHGLGVRLKDASLAEPTRQQLLKTLPAGLVVRTWEDENSHLLEALRVERNVMFYLLFFVMIVAAFGITSSQITFVVQRTPEIGTLKALGATGGQIMRVFLSQSLFVAALGLTFGFGIGLLALEFRNEFLVLMRDLTGFEIFPASIYGFQALPAQIVPGDLVKIGVGSFFICLLGGVLPAWNASRLRPVEAFRLVLTDAQGAGFAQVIRPRPAVDRGATRGEPRDRRGRISLVAGRIRHRQKHTAASAGRTGRPDQRRSVRQRPVALRDVV